jgi:hypothetical protein
MRHSTDDIIGQGLEKKAYMRNKLIRNASSKVGVYSGRKSQSVSSDNFGEKTRKTVNSIRRGVTKRKPNRLHELPTKKNEK